MQEDFASFQTLLPFNAFEFFHAPLRVNDAVKPKAQSACINVLKGRETTCL